MESIFTDRVILFLVAITVLVISIIALRYFKKYLEAKDFNMPKMKQIKKKGLENLNLKSKKEKAIA